METHGTPQVPQRCVAGWWFGTFFIFPIYLEESSQLTFIFFRGVGIPPTSLRVGSTVVEILLEEMLGLGVASPHQVVFDEHTDSSFLTLAWCAQSWLATRFALAQETGTIFQRQCAWFFLSRHLDGSDSYLVQHVEPHIQKLERVAEHFVFTSLDSMMETGRNRFHIVL